MSSRAFPILFVAPARAEEAILVSGVLPRLAQEIPDARFTIVASPAATPYFEQVPALDALLPMPKGALAKLGLTRRLSVTRWGLIADLEGIGIDGVLRRRKRAARHGPWSGHPTLAAAKLLNLPEPPPLPALFVNAATERLAAQLTDGQGPILALAPGADWIGKAWPAERFAEIAARLIAREGLMRGAKVLVLGEETQREAISAVRQSIPRHLLISPPMETSPQLDFALLMRARLFIGNDNPVTLLAAAAGAPTLALYGPSDETALGPAGPHVLIVRGPRTRAEFLAIDPGLNQEIGHMMDLPVGRVTAAAQALLAET